MWKVHVNKYTVPLGNCVTPDGAPAFTAGTLLEAYKKADEFCGEQNVRRFSQWDSKWEVTGVRSPSGKYLSRNHDIWEAMSRMAHRQVNSPTWTEEMLERDAVKTAILLQKIDPEDRSSII